MNCCVSLLDLWDIEEQGIDSQPTSKYSVQEDTKDPIPDKSHLTGEQEPVKEVSNEPTSEVIKEYVSQSTVTSVKQEKPVVTAATHSGVTASEKLSERNDLDMKDKPTLQESAELVTHRTEQTSQLKPNNQEKSESEHHDPFPAELSKKLTEDTRSGDETADVEPQTTLHKRENSNGSVDSSWSKLSEEELKANGDNKEGTVLVKCKLTVPTRNSIVNPQSFQESCFEARVSSIKVQLIVTEEGEGSSTTGKLRKHIGHSL